MKPIYRIIKHTYHERCDVNRIYYTIQKQKKFLIWNYWSTIKELVCGMGDCYKTSMQFNSESEAVYAVKKLESGIKADGWTEEISVVLDYNKKGVGD